MPNATDCGAFRDAETKAGESFEIAAGQAPIRRLGNAALPRTLAARLAASLQK